MNFSQLIKHNISVSQGFDRCLFYDPHFPPSEILEWFSDWNDEHWVTIPLPPNLYNDSTWMGLVLCASFSVDVNQTAHIHIMDSEYYCLMFQFVLKLQGILQGRVARDKLQV